MSVIVIVASVGALFIFACGMWVGYRLAQRDRKSYGQATG